MVPFELRTTKLFPLRRLPRAQRNAENLRVLSLYLALLPAGRIMQTLTQRSPALSNAPRCETPFLSATLCGASFSSELGLDGCPSHLRLPRALAPEIMHSSVQR